MTSNLLMYRALWAACEGSAAEAGGSAQLIRQRVPSLQGLEASSGPYAAVIVAAGAAVGALAGKNGPRSSSWSPTLATSA